MHRRGLEQWPHGRERLADGWTPAQMTWKIKLYTDKAVGRMCVSCAPTRILGECVYVCVHTCECAHLYAHNLSGKTPRALVALFGLGLSCHILLYSVLFLIMCIHDPFAQKLIS